MSDGSTVTGKAIDKLTSALEKVVDVRMLVLGFSLLLYTDIWLESRNIDIATVTFEDGSPPLGT